ncbi:SDR family NAD(P)-dependent oxidoreductase [uncultured Dysgonomonas sp.]|uniref:Short-chain dehydrogenase/reductase SDR n=1 Tax=uncultured Dysgonomonas sp. TaxID=206096 RepID=A0A212J8J0_9BACT|nr:SDR family NAD(P)-dependent oxidoreductase [uncultured Dysgonomonas sp.]SBV95763.1 Short-chain dehydrogenase/reductase SDR [uncultured Dysgonomonas sp.]
MKRTIHKIIFAVKRVPLILRSLRKVYRYGGYTTTNIAYINCGEVLKGKNILITGGSSGIGFCIAKKCVQEGATVVITGRDENKLKQAKEKINSSLLKVLTWDISQIANMEEGILKTKELLNNDIDILVNNAGIVNSIQFPNVTEEVWDKVYATNSKGLFFLTQSLCGKWIKENKIKQRKIINISSQGGFVGAVYPYRMTKWDIAGLTQGLAIKLAPYGIIVNGIAPGVVVTNMQSDFQNRAENVYCTQNPLERFALPEEIAELAVFLMSDASNFITGQTIICDGGYTIK